MDRPNIQKLCLMLKDRGGLKDMNNMLTDEHVAMFLHILAHHVKNRIVRRIFGRSTESISRHYHNVLNDVLLLQRDLLKAPKPVPANSTDYRWKYFEVYN